MKLVLILILIDLLFCYQLEMMESAMKQQSILGIEMIKNPTKTQTATPQCITSPIIL